MARPVTPFVGVWIEIKVTDWVSVNLHVTPFVGVWIEMSNTKKVFGEWESHSLRGSVD